jgi:UDP-GlcNAc:undecaprenyl-phosphate GlcNAc-1-phosphate transferase
MNAPAAFALGALGSAAAALAAARLAPGLGLADDPQRAPHRKLQAEPVPAVGGFGLLAGLAVLECIASPLPGGPGAWGALLLALALGTVDDRTPGGLPAPALLLGQSVVAAALLATGWRVCAGPPAPALVASFLAVLAAINAVNTFDNSDGAATALGILGLAPGAALLAAPLAGFLPLNLSARRGSPPVAYLGNGGSHVVGVLLVLDPVGRAALLLPALDLLRLAFVRLAAGSRPWIGDRRHLAHRLHRAGVSAPLAAVILAAIAAPAVLGASAAQRANPALLGAGIAATVLCFAAAVRFTPAAE